MKEYRRRSSAVRRGFDRASKEAFRVVGDFDGCYPDEVGADMPVELYFETGKGEGGYRIFDTDLEEQPTDGTASVTPELHEGALRDFELVFGQVVTVGELEGSLAKLPQAAAR